MKIKTFRIVFLTILINAPMIAQADYVTGVGAGQSPVPYGDSYCQSSDYEIAKSYAWLSADQDAEEKCKKMGHVFAVKESVETLQIFCKHRTIPYADSYFIAKAVVSGQYKCAVY